ncbi:MAG TPA: shikimate kinase [Rhodocyclaceae bacterium]|nr:shikimate kinase [Rhodocyclaceae bacterium]
MPSNIVLIGMPGSGKSTVGVILAKKTMRDFVDTDILIQKSLSRPLQDIVDNDGYLALREIEEQVLLDLHVQNHVISTGGSAVYGDAAMKHLKADGVAVFLDVTLETLEARVPDFSTRGLAKRPDQSFAELFEERNTLYRKYADVTVKCDGLTVEEVCARIMERTA